MRVHEVPAPFEEGERGSVLAPGFTVAHNNLICSVRIQVQERDGAHKGRCETRCSAFADEAVNTGGYIFHEVAVSITCGRNLLAVEI